MLSPESAMAISFFEGVRSYVTPADPYSAI